jgi:glycosyltransferase involved in cell wall biosynthesis
MAAHNHHPTNEAAVRDVLSVKGDFEIELIVVDDGSKDRTAEIVRSIADHRLVLVRKDRCAGKGAAILSAVAVASGTHLLIFDADLEYSARDIPALVQPLLEGRAEVVYGARVAGMGTSFSSSRFKLGSDLTTLFTNVVFDAWLKDMHTCLKLVPLYLLRQLSLSEKGFGLDTEITGELLRRGIRPYEVPCSFRGRSIAAGKKITARDGIECLKVALKVRLRGRVEPLAAGTSYAGREQYQVLRPALSGGWPAFRAGGLSESSIEESAAARQSALVGASSSGRS